MKKLLTAFAIWAACSFGAAAQTRAIQCDQPVALNQTGAPIPQSSIGCNGETPLHVLSAASTNSTLIGASRPHLLFDVVAINTNAATAFLKFYDTAAAPTCNTATVVHTIPLVQNIPVAYNSARGFAFSNGIGICITAGIADTDNTNATTGIAVSFGFK